MNAPRLPLGELLVLRGLISQDQLAIALTEQTGGAKLGEMLIRLGFITEAAMREALSEKIGTRTVDLSRLGKWLVPRYRISSIYRNSPNLSVVEAAFLLGIKQEVAYALIRAAGY